MKNTNAGVCLLAQIDAAIATAPSVNDAKLLVSRSKWRNVFYGWEQPDSADRARIGYIAFASQDTRYKVLYLRERLIAFRRAIDLAHRVQPKPRNTPYKGRRFTPMPEPERLAILATGEIE